MKKWTGNRLLHPLALCIAIIILPESMPVSGAPDITIYGTPGCGYCIEMTDFLKKENIPYVFRDVTDNDGEETKEMYAVVAKANYRTRYFYPVMNIRGQVVMRPSTEDVKKALEGKKIKGLEEREYKDPNWRPGFPKSIKYSYEDIQSRVREGDVTYYDNNTPLGRKAVAALKKRKVPFRFVQVKPGDQAYREMRAKLDDAGFGKKTVLPVTEVKGTMVMKARDADVILLLIECYGD